MKRWTMHSGEEKNVLWRIDRLDDLLVEIIATKYGTTLTEIIRLEFYPRFGFDCVDSEKIDSVLDGMIEKLSKMR